MATELKTIAEYLNNNDWKYYTDAKNDRIVTGVKADNIEQFLISIQLSENGEFIQFIVPEILKVKDHVFKGLLFQTMLTIQNEIKMLRFGYDPDDGEIYGFIDFPLEDGVLTEKQFNRALKALIYLVDTTAMPRLKAVLATGNDPGKKNTVEELLDALPDDLVAMLAQAIASRQQ